MTSTEGSGCGSGHGEDEPHVLEERQWSTAGTKIAACTMNEKMIEEKEMKLRSVIEENYSRIRDVEKELGDLQMQLKLTAGPKRSVLEMLRRKIEDQNSKCGVERAKVQKAKLALEEAEERLKKEQDLKDQLCQELNLVVQESAHAQLNKLEQLTARLEQLGSGIAGSGPVSNSLMALKATVTADAAAATAEATAAAAAATDGPATHQPEQPEQQQQQQQPGAGGDSHEIDRSSVACEDAAQKASKKTAKKPARSKQAEDARRRHVALPGEAAGSHKKSCERPQQRGEAEKQRPASDYSNPFMTNVEADQRRTNPFVDQADTPFSGFDT